MNLGSIIKFFQVDEPEERRNMHFQAAVTGLHPQICISKIQLLVSILSLLGAPLAIPYGSCNGCQLLIVIRQLD